MQHRGLKPELLACEARIFLAKTWQQVWFMLKAVKSRRHEAALECVCKESEKLAFSETVMFWCECT